MEYGIVTAHGNTKTFEHFSEALCSILAAWNNLDSGFYVTQPTDGQPEDEGMIYHVGDGVAFDFGSIIYSEEAGYTAYIFSPDTGMYSTIPKFKGSRLTAEG